MNTKPITTFTFTEEQLKLFVRVNCGGTALIQKLMGSVDVDRYLDVVMEVTVPDLVAKGIIKKSTMQQKGGKQ